MVKGPAMANLIDVVKQLRAERERAARELERLDTAIAALSTSRNGARPARRARPRLSASARRKIAAAQRARWARFRAQRKGEKKAA